MGQMLKSYYNIVQMRTYVLFYMYMLKKIE